MIIWYQCTSALKYHVLIVLILNYKRRCFKTFRQNKSLLKETFHLIYFYFTRCVFCILSSWNTVSCCGNIFWSFQFEGTLPINSIIFCWTKTFSCKFWRLNFLRFERYHTPPVDLGTLGPKDLGTFWCWVHIWRNFNAIHLTLTCKKCYSWPFEMKDIFR